MSTIPNFDEIRKKLKSYLTQQQIYDVILDSFDTLKLDRDKVELCWVLLSDSNLFPVFNGLNVKSKELSEKFRLEGNHSFASGRDLQAIRSYTLAAGHAVPDSKESVLAVANRSAVSCCLNDHHNCLRDIDYALSKSYPENLKYKLLERKGKSLISLGHSEAAKSTLKDALASLSCCDLTDYKLEKVRTDILELLAHTDELESDARCTTTQHDQPIPVVSYNPNGIILSASDCIDIAHSDDMGRHLIATRDIFPGDVLAIEKPYISILLPESAGLYCSHCLKRCHSLQPCPHCTGVYYCSAECELIAWNRYHMIECSLLKALLALGCGKLELLAVRTVVEAAGQGADLVQLVAATVKLDQVSVPPVKRGFTDGLYSSSTYDVVHFLEGNSHHRSSMDLFRRAIAAASIVEVIDSASSFFRNSSIMNCDIFSVNNFAQSRNGESGTNILSSFKLLEPYFRHSKIKSMGEMKAFVGGLLLKYLQVMPSNAHEVSEMLVDKSADTAESTEVGGALYPLLSLINHSCDPNVVRHSHHGDTVVLTAIQFIPKGDQIFDNYGYHHAVHDRTYRQASLLSQYHFYCKCNACLYDWPLFQNMPDSNPRYLYGADVKRLQASSDKFNKKLTDILNLTSGDNLPFLNSHLKLLHDGVERPWKEYSACQEAIKQCLSLRANHYVTNS